jgi:hypothetical protein
MRLCEANLCYEPELENQKCVYLLIRKVDHSHPEDGILNCQPKNLSETTAIMLPFKKTLTYI